MDVERTSWMDAEPGRLTLERDATAAVAPELEWDDTGAWIGLVPVWPFDRQKPSELDTFLAGRRFTVRVEYSQGYPMVAPRVWPIDPCPDLLARGSHDWHVNGNGTLCLLQTASAWDGTGTAADIIVKAAGWFLEYLLMIDDHVEAMSTDGIVDDDSRDHLFSSAPPTAGTS